MKKNLSLFIWSIYFIAGLQGLSACTKQEESSKVVTEQTLEDKSSFKESTEEKLDELLTNYVDDMKIALAEPDDKKAAAKIRQIKEQYSTSIEKLQAEMETLENSLSEEEIKALEQRIENKPYFKDLFATSLAAMGRINNSPELRKAFEDLNANMSFINDNLSSEEVTGEEYPEEIVESVIAEQ